MPNMLGRITSVVAARTTARRARSGNALPDSRCAKPSRRRQFSTMITAPSTIRPKSSAPRLMRLPLIRFSTMPVIVSSIDSGITSVVTSAARMLPRRANSTATTRSAPPNRLLRTVAIVLSTRRRAVVDRFELQAFRQRQIDLLELRRSRARHDAAVLAHQHEHGAEHDFLAVHRRGARAQILPDRHFGQIADRDRRAVAASRSGSGASRRASRSGRARARDIGCRSARCSPRRRSRCCARAPRAAARA